MTMIQENPPQRPRAVSPDWHWHIPGPTKCVQYYASMSMSGSLPTFLCQSQFSALAWFWFHSQSYSFVSNRPVHLCIGTGADFTPLLTSPSMLCWGNECGAFRHPHEPRMDGPSLRPKRTDRDPIQSSNRWRPEQFETANELYGPLPIPNTPGPPPISSEDHCLKRLGA